MVITLFFAPFFNVKYLAMHKTQIPAGAIMEVPITNSVNLDQTAPH